MKNYFFLTFLIFSNFLFSQTLNWVKTFGGSGLDAARAMVVDNQGNVYTTGPFNDTVDFDPGIGVFNLTAPIGSGGVFVQKLDANGNFIWAKSFTSSGYGNSSFDIVIDSQDNLIITGYFSGTADFDPSISTFNLISGSNYQDIFIWKLSNNGNFIWAKSLKTTSGFNSINEAKGLTIDNLDNIFITGRFYNQVDFDPNLGTNILTDTGFSDAYILKLNSNGNLVWAKQLEGASGSRGEDVKVDISGNVYITGYHSGQTDFDPGPNQLLFNQNGTTYSDVFLMKLDSNGNLIWANTYNDGWGFEIQIDFNNNVYLTGFIKNTTDFDPSINNYILNNSGTDEVFLLKVSEFNQFIAAIKFNSSGGIDNNQPNDMFISDNKLYVTGKFFGITNFGTITQPRILNAVGQYDVFLISTDLNLNPLTANNFGSNDDDDGWCVVNKNCSIYLCGNFQNTMDFDPQTSVFNITSNDSAPSPPYGDAFVLKLNDINTTLAPTGNSSQVFCNSATIADLSVTGSSIQWYSTSTGGTPLASNTILVNGSSYYASQNISGCEGTVRLPVLVTINTTTVPIGSSNQIFCNGATIANLSVTGLNIQWYSSSTGGAPLALTTFLVNGNTYYASQTISGCEGVTRIPVSVTINTTLAPIGNSSQAFCNSATISDLSVTGSNIQWYSSSTGGTPLASSTILVNGITYYASQNISGCEGTTRLPVLVTINITAAPTGSSNQAFCNGATIANLSVTGSNIQWYSTLTGGTPLSSTTFLVDGSSYYASQTTSGCEGILRLPVSVTINTTAAPTGSSNQVFCNGATIADLSVIGSLIQWYSSPVSGVPLASNTLLINGNTYYASQTVNNCESSSFLTVTTSINNVNPPSGNSNQSFCNSANISNLTAIGTNIQWYSSATGGAPLNSTLQLFNGSTYYASQTINGCISSTRLPVNVVITISAVPTGNNNQVFCNSATIADLIANGTNIQWYLSSTGGTPISISTPLISGITYYASQNPNGCLSTQRFPVNVIVNNPTTPSGNTNQFFCNSATIANLIANGINIQWYSSSNGGTSLSQNTILINGSTYYASQTINGCESLVRFAVNVTISNPQQPTGNNNQTFCLSDNPTVSDLQLNQTNILWYSSLANSTPLNNNTLLVDGQTYYASQIDTSSGCESMSRFTVDIIILNTPIPSGSPKQRFCIEENPTISSLSMDSNQLIWYDAPVNGNILTNDHIIGNGEIIYAEGFDSTNNCRSVSRFQVEIEIINPELEFYNLITVNNNSSNYKLTISGLEQFPLNEINIFNRYGEVVWRSFNYNNTSNYFSGKANINGVYMQNNFLPTGTYYFVLNFSNPCKKNEIKGFFQIDNSN
jgi:hypothetical protein